jgi:hypothetical protein
MHSGLGQRQPLTPRSPGSENPRSERSSSGQQSAANEHNFPLPPNCPHRPPALLPRGAYLHPTTLQKRSRNYSTTMATRDARQSNYRVLGGLRLPVGVTQATASVVANPPLRLSCDRSLALKPLVSSRYRTPSPRRRKLRAVGLRKRPSERSELLTVFLRRVLRLVIKPSEDPSKESASSVRCECQLRQINDLGK